MIDFKQFDVISAGDEFEVIDVRSGRPVDRRPSRRSANGIAFRLNQAAAEGGLIGALSNPRNPANPQEPQRPQDS